MERYICYRIATFKSSSVREGVRIERISVLKSMTLREKSLNIKYDNTELHVQLDLDLLAIGENTEKLNENVYNFLINGGVFDLAHYQKESMPVEN